MEYMTSLLKGRLQVQFPKPPGWSSLPWERANRRENPSRIDPMVYSWDSPGVTIMPCAEPMYFGPGQVSIWPILDLQDHVQRGKKSMTKFEFERLLENTTVQVLQREYGIDAYTIPSSPGVWVESHVPPREVSEFDRETMEPTEYSYTKSQNTRRIATVHADVVNDVTRFGVSIHVGQPVSTADYEPSQKNPWSALKQQDRITSIAAELSYKGSSTQLGSAGHGVAESQRRRSNYLLTSFDEKTPPNGHGLKTLPYSLIRAEDGSLIQMPMGMDNRDLSTAWTFEFARQLGMHDGFIEHFGMVDFGAKLTTNLPSRERNIGFQSRLVATETTIERPYTQVEVPAISLTKDVGIPRPIIELTKVLEAKDGKFDPIHPEKTRFLLSWPLYLNRLTSLLEKSINGEEWDTRLKHYLWQQEKAARIKRRREMLVAAENLEKGWRNGPRAQLIRRPLTDPIIDNLSKLNLDIQQQLKLLKSHDALKGKLMEQTVRIESLLRSRYVHPKDSSPTNDADSSSREIGDSVQHSLQVPIAGKDQYASDLLDENKLPTESGRIGQPVYDVTARTQEPRQRGWRSLMPRIHRVKRVALRSNTRSQSEAGQDATVSADERSSQEVVIPETFSRQAEQTQKITASEDRGII